ncbi:hypothetical protein LXL04_006589 [Taraxacum kok-saghyz]
MVGVYWAARPYDAGDLVGLSRRERVSTKLSEFNTRYNNIHNNNQTSKERINTCATNNRADLVV